MKGQRCSDPEVGKKLQYLSTRTAQMQYPTYQAAGWPIGSGMVESANKLVVEARLKGAGMHWKPEHVNPMLLLRNAVCNDRWEETWQGRMKQAHQSRSRSASTTPRPALNGRRFGFCLSCSCSLCRDLIRRNRRCLL